MPRGLALRKALELATRQPAQSKVAELDHGSFRQFLSAVRASPLLWPSPASQIELVTASSAQAHLLPCDLRNAVRSVHTAEASPCVLIRGVPVPYECPPVQNPFLDALPARCASAFIGPLAVQAGVGSLAGQQYTFAAERGENLFHFVLPVRGVPAASQSSVGGSAVNFHTEDPIPPIEVFQPQALTLLMFRPSGTCFTALTNINAMAADLLSAPSTVLDVLTAPRFLHPVPDVFHIMQPDRDLVGCTESAVGAPVLYERKDDTGALTPAIMLQEYTAPIHPGDEDASNALSALREILMRRAELHALQPGEMLVWANWRTAHARIGSLDPTFDGRDRLLSRTFHHGRAPALVVR